jgi:hypothetical protein
LEKLKAGFGRQLQHCRRLKDNPDTPWVLGGTAMAIFLGYLIAHM